MPDSIEATIEKWGNSAGIRLNAPLLKELNLKFQDKVIITVHGEEIVIRAKKVKPSLDDLVSRFNIREHAHQLMLDGSPVGQETL